MMISPDRTHWSKWLQAAVQAGVPPEAFWRLSLKEWRALMGAHKSSPEMSRSALEELIAHARKS